LISEKTYMKKLAICTLAFALVLSAGYLFLLSPAEEALDKADLSKFVSPTQTQTMHLEANRPNYPYSVVPFGAYSSGELTAKAQADPVIREHYEGFDLSRTHTVMLNRSVQQYVGFRVNDRLFRSKRKLWILKGEVLLTDGTHYARARCGNRLFGIPGHPGPHPPTDEELTREIPPSTPKQEFQMTPPEHAEEFNTPLLLIPSVPASPIDLVPAFETPTKDTAKPGKPVAVIPPVVGSAIPPIVGFAVARVPPVAILVPPASTGGAAGGGGVGVIGTGAGAGVVVVTPEPSTFGLLIAGLFVALMVLRRKTT
jgi:hypothetical protein